MASGACPNKVRKEINAPKSGHISKKAKKGHVSDFSKILLQTDKLVEFCTLFFSKDNNFHCLTFTITVLAVIKTQFNGNKR